MEIENTFREIDSITLANYILKHYGPMSHLKLQKLIFYCDAYCLAYFGRQLVTDRFEAWVHGPVSRKVYDSLKDKSVLFCDVEYSDTGGTDVDAAFARLSSAQRELLTAVLGDLAAWTGLELETATHRETPWLEARRGYGEADKCSVEISKDATRDFYRQEQYAR